MPSRPRSFVAAVGFGLAVCAAAHARAQLPDPRVLHVIRHAPADSAASSGVVMVAFDRPVAGMLDRSVAVEKIFHITPAIRGALSWRDPATIRFIPEKPLVPGDSFTVTIDTTFSAMDGARLEAPYRFRFRVPGPRLLRAEGFSEGNYVGNNATGLAPDASFFLVFSAALDSTSLARLNADSRLEFPTDCGVRRVPLRVVSQRPIPGNARWPIAAARAVPDDTVGDGFRRVVELAPTSLLPEECLGFWYVASIDPAAPRDVWRYNVATRPRFALVKPACQIYNVCTADRVEVAFTAPVRRADVERYVTITPRIDAKLTTTADGSAFTFTGPFAARRSYFIHLSPELRDTHGRAFTGDTLVEYAISNRLAAVTYEGGLRTVPRGSDMLRVRISNADTLRLVVKPVPEQQRPRAIRRYYLDQNWFAALPDSSVYFIAPNIQFNVEKDTLIAVPRGSAGDATLLAVALTVTKPSTRPPARPGEAVDPRVRRAAIATPIALIQASDVVIHAKVGDDRAAIFVTGARDGRPVADARVTVRDTTGALVGEGRTDRDGLASVKFRSIDWMMQQLAANGWWGYELFGCYVEVESRGGRAAQPLGTWGADEFNPSQLGGGWRSMGGPAATIFTDRGIYRPGETVYLESIVRLGSLGELTPLSRDSVRVTFSRYGEEGLDTTYRAVLRTSDLGTAVDSVRLRALAPLGGYQAIVAVMRGGKWMRAAQTFFAVAEYRAPEFAVVVRADSVIERAGEAIHVDVGARYLFGAPMAGGVVNWSMNAEQLSPWELHIPHTEGFVVGGWSYDDWLRRPHGFAKYGVDTLDASGNRQLRLVPVLDSIGGDARVTFNLAVADVNRQTVTASASSIVRTASFYLAARDMKRGWYWRPGVADSIGVIAVRANGERLAGIRVEAQLLRRNWTYDARGGTWRVDTVATMPIVTDTGARQIKLTPPAPGQYQVHFTARDERGRLVSASLFEYAFGSTNERASPLALTIVAPKDTLRAGDVATLAYTSPFEDAEAWITIEREHVIEQRRETVRAGGHEVRVEIADRFAPNVFVSVALVNHGSAPASDSLSQLMRVGYARLTVSTEPRRLTVALAPQRRLLGPAESATIDVRLTDHGRPVRGEAAVWAVDQGVLSLTGYAAPDPLSAIYAPRGVGSIFASTMSATIAARTPPPIGDLMSFRGAALGSHVNQLNEVVVTSMEAPGESRAQARGAGVQLRQSFRTTAFFLGQTTTDAEGHARLHVKMPDNLTTFRLIAVAVTADQYGSATDSLLVTRPLVARPSLPRFVRPGDSVYAGVAVTARNGASQRATVSVAPENVVIRDSATQTLSLGATSSEVRWHFDVPATDTAGGRVGFRFDASAPAGADAVKIWLPVQPANVPRAHTIAGVARGTSRISFELPADIDPARSRLSLDVATSPLGVLHWAYRYLEAYPYYCTEQLMSTGRAMVAVYRARQSLGPDSADAHFLGSNPVQSIEGIATEISKRQRSDGGIRYWREDPWTSAWLSANAGLFLLEAREAGATIEQPVLDRLATFIQKMLKQPVLGDTMNGTRADRRVYIQWRLSQRLAMAQFLRRAGTPNAEAEQQLVTLAPRLSWEDRVWLAELLAMSDRARATALLDAAWSSVTTAGRRIDMPDSTLGRGDFMSHVRPPARLLLATLAIQPEHPRIGALMETILQLGRAERSWAWNTQDYSSAIIAAARLSHGQRDVIAKGITVHAGDATSGPALIVRSSSDRGDGSVTLAGLTRGGGPMSVDVPLTVAGGAPDSPLYYSVTVTEVPRGKSTIADSQGIFVERWYERYSDRAPVTSVNAGDLVRVHLRITVPSDRQFVALDDALPAGLEAVDLSLRTSATLGPFETVPEERGNPRADADTWTYGSWQQGWWSPWEHREMRDDRVVYFARMLWKGTYDASYVARATTAGTFVLPPARAEEMYNPALQGRSAGGTFVVRER